MADVQWQISYTGERCHLYLKRRKWKTRRCSGSFKVLCRLL